MIPIYIGYDARESIVYHVCANSIIRHASTPVALIPLALGNLTDYSERHIDGSNAFIYSRFLVPHLQKNQGWAMFIDGDMILRCDVDELWRLRDDSKAVMCVKHDYKTKSSIKYLGAKNEDYPRKNWSSVVLWNCAHPANNCLVPKFIEGASGSTLHRFTWLKDELIGELPIEWNWLPDEFGVNNNANLLHWTLGAPCFHEYSMAPMANEWHREALLAKFSDQL